MNCLEFRRAALFDPRRLDAEAARHAGQCPACSEFHARGLEFEERLEEALRVPVPAGLTKGFSGRSAMARRPMRWLALAASLVVAAGIGYLAGTLRPDPLARAGIDFVVFEEAQSIVDAKPTDWKLLVRAAAEMGVSLPGQLGDIRYVCVYPFVAGAAHHLLVKTPLGKVTVLLIPERPVASRAAETAYGLEAVVRPAGKGSVVIVGDTAQSVRRAETFLRNG